MSIDRIDRAALFVFMNRFWIVPFFFAILVIGPFLIWGDVLTALLTPQGALEMLARYETIGWAVGIGLLVSDLFLPIPTTAIIAALGILYGPIKGAFIALAGTLIAAIVGYVIGRFLGRPAAQRFIGPAADNGQRIFARYGGWIVAISRWMPVLPEVVSCVAGVSRMPFAAFLGAVFCGALPLCITFALIGHLGADTPGWTLIISALVPIVLWYGAERSGLARRFGLERSMLIDKTRDEHQD